MLRSWQLPEPDSDAYVPASRLNVFSRAMPLKKSGVAPVWSGCFTPVVGAGVKWTMRERRFRQDALFYEFSLEDHVPEGHLLRSIDRFIELDGLRQELAPFYSAIGRPSMIYCLGPSGLCTTRGASFWSRRGRRFVHRSNGRCISRQCPSAETTSNFFSMINPPRVRQPRRAPGVIYPEMLGSACPVVPFSSAELSHIWDNPEIPA